MAVLTTAASDSPSLSDLIDETSSVLTTDDPVPDTIPYMPEVYVHHAPSRGKGGR